MRDLNFNPGIGLGHLIVHKNKYIGERLFDGRARVETVKIASSPEVGIKITLAAAVLLNKNWEVQFKGLDTDRGR